jgi:hypothetical protein
LDVVVASIALEVELVDSIALEVELVEVVVVLSGTVTLVGSAVNDVTGT